TGTLDSSPLIDISERYKGTHKARGTRLSSRPQRWREIKPSARAFIVAVVALGVCVLFRAGVHWSSSRTSGFVVYLSVAGLASRLKVDLPGITGTMSVYFLFILLGIIEFSLPETLILGCTAIVAQCLYRDRPSFVQVLFNVCASAVAIQVAYAAYHLSAAIGSGPNRSIPLIAAAVSYFVGNTLPVATVISLTEGKPLRKIWSECYFWSFPYYLGGAAVAALVGWFNRILDWRTALLVL